MKFTRYAIIPVVLWLYLIKNRTKASCSSHPSWKQAESAITVRQRLLVGEWILINCAVDTSENSTLLLNGNIVHVDNKKIKMSSINVFNITNLARSDSGQYTCKVCNKSKKVTKLLVLPAGKAFLKPVVIKKPNRALYDLGDKVELLCRVDNSNGEVDPNEHSNYGHAWYKRRSNGDWEPLKGDKRVVNDRKLLFNQLLKEDEGTYKCEMSRSVVNHYAFALVNITFKERSKPKIHFQKNEQVLSVSENKDFLLSYNVVSYPESDIDWWSSKDGKNYKLITRCFGGGTCNKHSGRENITRKSFELRDAEFPRDNLSTYTLYASNTEGNDSKSFKIEVYVRPEIQRESASDVFYKKGMAIKCTLKNKDRVNPPQVNYTWHQCDVGHCNKSNGQWRLVNSNNSSLIIQKPVKGEMKYRCTVGNVAGYDKSVMTIYSKQPIVTENRAAEKSIGTLLFIVIPVGLICMT